MKNSPLLFIIFFIFSCNQTTPSKIEFSDGFITLSYIHILYSGSNNSNKHDSIQVRWATKTDWDGNNLEIYKKNTLIDCHGNKQIIISGDLSSPDLSEVSDCPNNVYHFELINSQNESFIYTIPFKFDSTFYSQKIGQFNNYQYKHHESPLCNIAYIGGVYKFDGGSRFFEFPENDDSLTVPTFDFVERDSLIGLTQTCVSQGNGLHLEHGSFLQETFILTL